jgi:hypothetical protein
VKASKDGQLSVLSVAARDSYGNVAAPVEVTVNVWAQSTEQQQCSRADRLKPDAVVPSSTVAEAATAMAGKAGKVHGVGTAAAAVVKSHTASAAGVAAAGKARTAAAAGDAHTVSSVAPATKTARASAIKVAWMADRLAPSEVPLKTVRIARVRTSPLKPAQAAAASV